MTSSPSLRGAARIIRALRARVDDSDYEVRMETIWSLIRHRDFAAVTLIRNRLTTDGFDTRLVEVVEELCECCQAKARRVVAK